MTDPLPVIMGMVAGKDSGDLVITPDGKGSVTPSGKDNCELRMEPSTTDVSSSFGFYKVGFPHSIKRAELADISLGIREPQPFDRLFPIKSGGLGSIKPGAFVKRDTEAVIMRWNQAHGAHAASLSDGLLSGQMSARGLPMNAAIPP